MQLSCLRVVGKILTITMLISTMSCSVFLEDLNVSKSFSCTSKKCCYNIHTKTTQVCGSSSGNDVIIIVIHQN